MKKIIILISLSILFISCSTTENAVIDTTETTIIETKPEPVKQDMTNFIEANDDKDVLKHGETRRR